MKTMKMKNYLWALSLGILALVGCGDIESKDGVQEVSTEGQIASIIRNPVTADGEIDTINVARMKFEEVEYDFGEVDEGEVITKTFSFTNTGRVPLVISGAKSSCGCTVPTWPEEPIPPGEGGEIEVQFNTAGKKNDQRKPVKITANTYPSETVIYVSGFVKEKTVN
jgi:hypothetical protein